MKKTKGLSAKLLDAFGVAGALVFIIIMLLLNGLIGGFAFPYVINHWLHFFGKPEAVVFWMGFILAYIPGIGQLALPLAAATWILGLFIG